MAITTVFADTDVNYRFSPRVLGANAITSVVCGLSIGDGVHFVVPVAMAITTVFADTDITSVVCGPSIGDGVHFVVPVALAITTGPADVDVNDRSPPRVLGANATTSVVYGLSIGDGVHLLVVATSDSTRCQRNQCLPTTILLQVAIK